MSNPGNPKAKENLVNSIRNQCRLAEGEKAMSELDKELCSNKTSSPSLTGAGNKQTGICMKFDCICRDDKCDECIKENLYASSFTQGPAITFKALQFSASSKDAGIGGRNA